MPKTVACITFKLNCVLPGGECLLFLRQII